MEVTFEKQTFGKRLKSMFKVDFRRVFTAPLVYIFAGVCFVLPILFLVMTSLMASGEGGEAAVGFTSVWQAISPASDAGMSMDLTGMCNMNIIYFLIAVFVCVFVAEEFKSGYVKNLFAVRSGKTDYCISKTVVCFVCGVIMLVAYFVGAMLGGSIAGLPFDAASAGAGGIVACLFSKLFLVAVFASIALIVSVAAKQRLWVSVVGSLAACMLLYSMLPMTSPLDASALHPVLCLAGGAAFAAGLGALSKLILDKTSLV